MKKCWNQSREREREKDSSFYLHRHQKLSLLRGSLWYLLVIFSFTGHMHLWRETDPKGLSCPLWKLKSLQLKLNFCPLCNTLALNDTFYLISTCWGMPPFWQTAPRASHWHGASVQVQLPQTIIYLSGLHLMIQPGSKEVLICHNRFPSRFEPNLSDGSCDPSRNRNKEVKL